MALERREIPGSGVLERVGYALMRSPDARPVEFGLQDPRSRSIWGNAGRLTARRVGRALPVAPAASRERIRDLPAVCAARLLPTPARHSPLTIGGQWMTGECRERVESDAARQHENDRKNDERRHTKAETLTMREGIEIDDSRRGCGNTGSAGIQPASGGCFSAHRRSARSLPAASPHGASDAGWKPALPV